MTNNLPEPDDAPWLNLSQEEINQLRYNKQNLTSYGREKIRALMLKSQMTDKKTLECEIEEYALEIEQKAKEIGKLKDILDRKEQQLKQMTEEETLALIKKWSPLLDKEQSPNVKAMLIESQETKVKETDTSKFLIEGDTATINGIKYKRVEEPKPQTLYEVLINLGYSYDRCYEIVDAVKEWLPDEHCNITDYDLGWNDVLRKIKDGLG